jgi:hypothetical protein
VVADAVLRHVGLRVPWLDYQYFFLHL